MFFPSLSIKKKVPPVITFWKKTWLHGLNLTSSGFLQSRLVSVVILGRLTHSIHVSPLVIPTCSKLFLPKVAFWNPWAVSSCWLEQLLELSAQLHRQPFTSYFTLTTPSPSHHLALMLTLWLHSEWTLRYFSNQGHLLTCSSHCHPVEPSPQFQSGRLICSLTPAPLSPFKPL